MALFASATACTQPAGMAGHGCHLFVCHLPTCPIRADKTDGKKVENSFVD